MNMFKIYGVTDTDKSTKKSTHEKHTTHDEHGSTSHNIDVEMDHDSDHETDIGQIAVDIIDTTGSIIIVAPIA
jgi:hypothetical protein